MRRTIHLPEQSGSRAQKRDQQTELVGGPAQPPTLTPEDRNKVARMTPVKRWEKGERGGK